MPLTCTHTGEQIYTPNTLSRRTNFLRHQQCFASFFCLHVKLLFSSVAFLSEIVVMHGLCPVAIVDGKYEDYWWTTYRTLWELLPKNYFKKSSVSWTPYFLIQYLYPDFQVSEFFIYHLFLDCTWLCSLLIPGGVVGTTWGARVRTQVSHVQGKDLTCYTIPQSRGFFYFFF